jgi:phosphoribosylanthranilate isomerase
LNPLPPTRPRVKICGLRRESDARLAMELGAAYLGVVLTARSPRLASLEEVRAIRNLLPQTSDARPQLVGVFVDESAEEIARWLREVPLDLVQIHGPIAAAHELIPSAHIIPAIAVRGADEIGLAHKLSPSHPACLLDAWSAKQVGGTGRVFDHQLAAEVVRSRPTFIAGGLNPDNITKIVAVLRAQESLPFAFDLSSGVEDAPGVKSHDKLRAFFANLNAAIDH